MSLPLSLDPQIRAELEPLGAELLGIFEKRGRRVMLLELPHQAGYVVVTDELLTDHVRPMGVDDVRATAIQFPGTSYGRTLAQRVTERYLAGPAT